MPQMKTSNMLDNYNIKDIHLRNGRDMLDIYGERAQCQAFYCSHTTRQRRWWLLLLGLAELKDQLSYQSLIPLLVVVAAEAFTAKTNFQLVCEKETETKKLFCSACHAATQGNNYYFACVYTYI